MPNERKLIEFLFDGLYAGRRTSRYLYHADPITFSFLGIEDALIKKER